VGRDAVPQGLGDYGNLALLPESQVANRKGKLRIRGSF